MRARRVLAAVVAQALVILVVNVGGCSDDDCEEQHGASDFDLGAVFSLGGDASPEAAADAIALLGAGRDRRVRSDASVEELVAMPCMESCRQVIEYRRPGGGRVDDCRQPTLGAEMKNTVGPADAQTEIIERAATVHCEFTWTECPSSGGSCIHIRN